MSPTKKPTKSKATKKATKKPTKTTTSAVDAAAPRPVPEVGPLRGMKVPKIVDRILPNGLRVVAAKRSGVPRVEARMLVPTARGNAGDQAQLQLLSKTILSGTEAHTSREIAEELQGLGGSLDAGSASEEVVLFGSALASDLRPFLALLAEVVEGANYPQGEVEIERDRLVQEISLGRSQPEMVAREAFLGRLFGKHPYGRGLPDPDRVAKVTSKNLRKVHTERVRPEGAVLVIVGDVAPAKAADAAASAFGKWAGGGAAPGLAQGVVAKPGKTLIVNRPGSVQTNIRIGGPGVMRDAADYPALALANLVFGGYFISRLVDNIREEKGYTYSPGSGVQQWRRGSNVIVVADVGTDVTAPALVEMRYELSRMVAGPYTDAELTSAKRYLAGTASMGIQTQSGLAANLANLAAAGLPFEFMRDYPKRVEALTAEEVRAASERYFSPRNLHTVLVGDADAIVGPVSAFDDVEVVDAVGG
ncbi:MAG: M16 family metallopeptidase [Acidimicrobiales bacterium]